MIGRHRLTVSVAAARVSLLMRITQLHRRKIVIIFFFFFLLDFFSFLIVFFLVLCFVSEPDLLVRRVAAASFGQRVSMASVRIVARNSRRRRCGAAVMTQQLLLLLLFTAMLLLRTIPRWMRQSLRRRRGKRSVGGVVANLVDSRILLLLS